MGFAFFTAIIFACPVIASVMVLAGKEIAESSAFLLNFSNYFRGEVFDNSQEAPSLRDSIAVIGSPIKCSSESVVSSG